MRGFSKTAVEGVPEERPRRETSMGGGEPQIRSSRTLGPEGKYRIMNSHPRTQSSGPHLGPGRLMVLVPEHVRYIGKDRNKGVDILLLKKLS